MPTANYSCIEPLARRDTPPQSYMCCGFCCDFPMYFYGTVGPAYTVGPFTLAQCTAATSWPTVETPVVFWRVGPCPQISYTAVGIQNLGLFIKASTNRFYPICEGVELSGAAFTDVWGVTNSVFFQGSCSKSSGDVVFSANGTIGLSVGCRLPFEITGWSGFTDSDCLKEGRPPSWCVKDVATNQQSCVTSWYYPGIAGVTTVLGGPYTNTSDCNTACGTSNETPWWCVGGGCVQSDTQPTNGTNTYNSEAECLNACFIDQGPGWYCHNYYDAELGYSTVGCDYFMSTPANSSQRHSSLEACASACINTTTTTTESPSTTTTTSGPTTTTTESPTTTTTTVSPEAGYYCVGFDCIYFDENPYSPSIPELGPYGTFNACQTMCTGATTTTTAGPSTTTTTTTTTSTTTTTTTTTTSTTTTTVPPTTTTTAGPSWECTIVGYAGFNAFYGCMQVNPGDGQFFTEEDCLANCSGPTTTTTSTTTTTAAPPASTTLAPPE